MTYEGGKLKRVGTSELTFEVYHLDLSDDDRQPFFDDPEAFLTRVIADEGAPEPNEFLFHLDPTADLSADQLIDEILSEIRSGGPGGGGPPSGMPGVAVYHQISGSHPSRYITIVVSS